jgi:predicted Zn finger-like uncharacterized protein
MKISCQMCEAKYTIADEKISGKIVKIKCKKCGSTIVVNGNEAGMSPGADPGPAGQVDGEDEGETRVAGSEPMPAAGADEWTVNVSDEDQRTMTSAQLVMERRRGTITDDTFVWKDGMSDWLPISGVPEIVQLLATPTPSSPPRPKSNFPTPSPNSGMGLGGTAIMGDSPPRAAAFAAPAPAARRAANRGPQVDLFGANGAPPEVAQPPPGYSSGSGSVGERNENSVLFSLSALTATESASKAGGGASSKSDDAVIDMRGPSLGSKNNGRAGLDDIMNLGGGGFGGSPALAPPPLLAPVIEPPPPPPPPPTASMPSQMPGPMMGMGHNPYMMAQPKRSPMGLIIGIVLGLMVVGGVGFFVLRPKPVETPTATNETKTPAPPVTEAAIAQAPTTEVKNPEAPPTTTGSTPSEATSGAPKVGSVPVGGPIVGGPKPEKTAAPEKSAAPTAEKPPEKPPEQPPVGEGGKEFNRGAASAALAAAAGGARGCKKPDGPTGSGRVRVTFAPSGNVTQSAVQGAPFAGTAVGGCVAAAFRGARVPPFDGSPVSVTKSFSIN